LWNANKEMENEVDGVNIGLKREKRVNLPFSIRYTSLNRVYFYIDNIQHFYFFSIFFFPFFFFHSCGEKIQETKKN